MNELWQRLRVLLRRGEFDFPEDSRGLLRAWDCGARVDPIVTLCAE